MSKALTTTPKGDKPATLKQFDTARRHATEITNLGRRAAHVSVLLGHELNRLKAELGAGHGGDRKSSSQVANLIPWPELVAQQTGLSYDTCQRCMKVATGAKKQLAILTAADVLKKPLSALPAKRQEEVVAAISKATDGMTMAQLMIEFGAWKEPKSKAPPKGGKSPKNDFKGGASNRTTDLDPEAMRELALQNGNTLRDIIQGGSWEYLNDDELAALDAMIDGWKVQTAALIKSREDAAAKGGKAR